MDPTAAAGAGAAAAEAAAAEAAGTESPRGMNSRKREMIEEGAREHLEDGESVLSSFIAQARGTTQAGMGGVNLIAGELGARRVGKQKAAAADAGVEIGHGPLAFVVTERRLITLQLGGMRQRSRV